MPATMAAEEHPEQDDPDVPSFYVDGANIGVSPFTVTIEFHTKQLRGKEATPAARLRMSPLHAKVLSIALRQQLKVYEQMAGASLAIPTDVAKQMKIPMEDW